MRLHQSPVPFGTLVVHEKVVVIAGSYSIAPNRAETGLDTDRIPMYPYPYLFYSINTDMDTDINHIQKFIFIVVLNRYGYKSDTANMDTNMDRSQIIKL